MNRNMFHVALLCCATATLCWEGRVLLNAGEDGEWVPSAHHLGPFVCFYSNINYRVSSLSALLETTPCTINASARLLSSVITGMPSAKTHRSVNPTMRENDEPIYCRELLLDICTPPEPRRIFRAVVGCLVAALVCMDRTRRGIGPPRHRASIAPAHKHPQRTKRYTRGSGASYHTMHEKERRIFAPATQQRYVPL